MRWIQLAVVFFWAALFTYHGGATTGSSADHKFIILSSDAEVLKGVEVLIITAKGVDSIGKTGNLGDLSIDKDFLRKEQPYAFIFCHEFFFCGAIPVDDETFYDYDEHLIALAPVMVR